MVLEAQLNFLFLFLAKVKPYFFSKYVNNLKPESLVLDDTELLLKLAFTKFHLKENGNH